MMRDTRRRDRCRTSSSALCALSVLIALVPLALILFFVVARASAR